MSKCEIIYVKGMKYADSEVDNEEDIWDDRKLNDAYDKALRIANAEVAKRIAMSTNSQRPDKSVKKPLKEHSVSKQSLKSDKKWKPKMPCRAVYDGDGVEYEAIVQRMVNSEECIVKFLGYENSEIVPLFSLQPSRGSQAQNKQIEQALQEQVEENRPSHCPGNDMEVGSDASTERSFHTKMKKTKKKNSTHSQGTNGNFSELPQMTLPPLPNLSALRNLSSLDMPLAPPPLPFPAGRVESEEQAVSTMLLSWYMSGYYTGLYQGLKRSQNGRKN